MEGKNKSKSKQLIIRLIYNLLQLLNENGGELRSSEIESKMAERLTFDEWESQPYASGGVRWLSYLHFYSIDCVKAGYIIKNKGTWYLTDDGRDAVEKMDAEQLYTSAHKAYLEWDKNRSKFTGKELHESDSISFFDDIKAKADSDLMGYISDRNPWEFQDMVAALFRAMGYYTPFIAPKGKDGGVDVIAYGDPLGATRPILKVQVKHFSTSNPVAVDVIRSIVAVAKGDVPIVVTSGRFTEDAKNEARRNNVRLIDGAEFTSLWIEYYPKMNEDDKARMPIEPIYFIKREE